MRGACLLSLAAVVLIPALAMSQVSSPTDSITVPAGSRVRVTSLGLGPRMIGTIVSANRDSVIFMPVGEQIPTSVRTADVKRLEVSRGWHRHPWAGLFLGALVGALATGGYEAATWKDPGGDFDFGKWGDAGIMAVPGALIGAVVGTLFGAQKFEDWGRVPLPRA